MRVTPWLGQGKAPSPLRSGLRHASTRQAAGAVRKSCRTAYGLRRRKDLASPVSGSCTLRSVALTVGVFVTISQLPDGSEVAASRTKFVASTGHERARPEAVRAILNSTMAVGLFSRAINESLLPPNCTDNGTEPSMLTPLP